MLSNIMFRLFYLLLHYSCRGSDIEHENRYSEYKCWKFNKGEIIFFPANWIFKSNINMDYYNMLEKSL